MKRSVTGKLRYRSIALAVILALIGCLGITSLSAAEKVPPTELNIGIISIAIMEQPWNAGFIQSLERVVKEKPHNLTIKWSVVAEKVFPTDAERVLNSMAKTGKYDIIWAHSAYADAVEKLHEKYPEILWVFAGSGNHAVGGNAYWADCYVNEPAYLLGIIAGMMTESNVLGAVGGYPYPNVNLPINAWLEGARSVNPDVKIKMSYIESWFDFPKAKEAALAQISAGADFIYAERYGPFVACKEKGKYAFGHFVDQHDMAPEVVVCSTITRWDPAIKVIINEWWGYKTNGTLYDAPMERVVFSMKEGGGDIAPFHSFDSKIPQKVKDAVKEARGRIMDGTLKVTHNEKVVKSD